MRLVHMDKNKAGRPSAITPKVVSLLVASFHSGLTIREACWQSGISHEAYYNNLRLDEQFADKMEQAQAHTTISAKKLIAKEISKGNVSAAKWWLERHDKFPVISVETPDEEPELDTAELDDQIASLDRMIALKKRFEAYRKAGRVLPDYEDS